MKNFGKLCIATVVAGMAGGVMAQEQIKAPLGTAGGAQGSIRVLAKSAVQRFGAVAQGVQGVLQNQHIGVFIAAAAGGVSGCGAGAGRGAVTAVKVHPGGRHGKRLHITTGPCGRGGGVDALARFTVGGFSALEAVSPERCNPLSANRRGINLGEAARRIDPAQAGKIPDVAWTQIIGLRNILAHGYEQVEHEVLFRSIAEDLPPLQRALEAWLSGYPS